MNRHLLPRNSQADRGKTLDAIKRHQDSISTKSKEITSIRQKLPYRNASEIQSRITQLDSQIESGKLKLIDEKKALNEISTLRRSSKQVSTLESLEQGIEEEKLKIDELRKVLDDPQVKQTQARWDELKREMDELREQQKKAYDERGGLFDKRNALSAKMVRIVGGVKELGQAIKLITRSMSHILDRTSCTTASALRTPSTEPITKREYRLPAEQIRAK